MNANIFRHEFRARLRSVLIWSAGIALLIGFYLSIYPSFAGQAALMDEMISKFPPELAAAFGLGNMDLASVIGFFSFLFVFVQLCLAIQASNYGFGLVSVEEADLTADFLLSKPVSRGQVLTSKLLAAICSLVVTDFVVWAASYVSVVIFRDGRDFDAGLLALILLSVLIFQFFFLSVGLLISLLVRRVRSVTPYGLGLAFGMYVLSAFSGVFGDVALEYLTPFKHFDAAAMAQDGGYNTPLVLLNLGVSLLALVLSYWLYLRRDIPAVS
jgi:ABC-2 type transport system permease protein